MLDMLKARKERDEQGFTLAELLIVVAIIAVLVAIAIPVFTTQLEKSREATDTANVRSAYAYLMSEYLTTTDSNLSTQVEARQAQDGWQGPQGTIVMQVEGTESEYQFSAKTNGDSYELQITSDGTFTIN